MIWVASAVGGVRLMMPGCGCVSCARWPAGAASGCGRARHGLGARPRATVMMSASVPWPARCGPAPGPVMVTCPTGVAWKTRAQVAPSMPASGSPAGTASGRTRTVTVPVP